MSVYLAMFSNEITWGAALLMGLGIGALVVYVHGKDHWTGEGFERGYEVGRRIGLGLGQEQRLKRDAKGRFVK